MNIITQFFEKVLSTVFVYYIELVYKTSKILTEGPVELLDDKNKEKMIIIF